MVFSTAGHAGHCARLPILRRVRAWSNGLGVGVGVGLGLGLGLGLRARVRVRVRVRVTVRVARLVQRLELPAASLAHLGV